MKPKTNVVSLGGERWEVRRLTPAVGSYIWQRLMAANVKAQSVNQDAIQATVDEAEEKRLKTLMDSVTPEQRLRGVCGIAFMYMTFEDIEFVQTAAMRVTSLIQNAGGVETPVPVMADDGRGLLPLLAEDPALVSQLVVEALAFSLVSFLQPTVASSRTATAATT